MFPDQTKHFILRHLNHYPPREAECRFKSPFEEEGSDVAFRFSYSFNALEIRFA